MNVNGKTILFISRVAPKRNGIGVEQRRITRVEFYGRLMDWHTKWSDEVRTMYHVNYYRRRALPVLHRVLRAQNDESAQPVA